MLFRCKFTIICLIAQKEVNMLYLVSSNINNYGYVLLFICKFTIKKLVIGVIIVNFDCEHIELNK